MLSVDRVRVHLVAEVRLASLKVRDGDRKD